MSDTRGTWGSDRGQGRNQEEMEGVDLELLWDTPRTRGTFAGRELQLGGAGCGISDAGQG